MRRRIAVRGDGQPHLLLLLVGLVLPRGGNAPHALAVQVRLLERTAMSEWLVGCLRHHGAPGSPEKGIERRRRLYQLHAALGSTPACVAKAGAGTAAAVAPAIVGAAAVATRRPEASRVTLAVPSDTDAAASAIIRAVI